jgi:hypothetical protein
MNLKRCVARALSDSGGREGSLILHYTGDQRQYQRRVVHCAGCWKANGAFWEWWEYHLDRFDEWKHHEQGVLFRLHDRVTCNIPERKTGSCVGVLQREQIRSIADGTKHGVRAGPEGHPGQYTLSGSHLHFVSGLLFAGDR